MDNEYIEKNRKAYNALASQYEYRLHNKSDYDDYFEKLVDEILLEVSPSDLINVLEIGPGAGEVLSVFENKGCRTTAVELSDEMCKLAKKTSNNTIIINQSILDVQFVEKQFDVVNCAAVLHNFPFEDSKILLNKIYGWLKDGGVFAISSTVEDKDSEGYYVKKDYNGEIARFRKKWTQENLETTIRESGFKIIKKFHTDELDREKRWIDFICVKEDKE
jgi:cyclopropane fatty-acyl-phospholipid synthase-like methyltransferase